MGGLGLREPGLHQLRSFFKADGAEEACRVGVPRLRTCFFKTDGAEKACRVGVPHLRACFFKTDGVCKACWDRYRSKGSIN